MKFLFREAPGYRKAHKRLSSVSPAVAQAWADQTLWATQAGLDGYRVTGDPAALEEAYRGVLGLLAAVDILRS